MNNQFNNGTNWFLIVFAALAAIALVLDWVHNNEPLENVGDEFAGWDINDEDFNSN